jgi:phage shock protein C
MKRLYKNRQNKMIFGVCAGLAEYFDCDPTIIRLITVGLAILTCTFVFWVYIIAAIIMPDKSRVLLP